MKCAATLLLNELFPSLTRAGYRVKVDDTAAPTGSTFATLQRITISMDQVPTLAIAA